MSAITQQRSSNNVIEWPIFIDYEASSLHEGSYPIEVGVALKGGRTESMLICPAWGWDDWDEASEAVHGIPRRKLMLNGEAASDVATKLNKLLGRNKVYCDGYPYDRFWQQQLFDKAGFSPSFDLQPLGALLNNEQYLLWDELKPQIVEQSGLTTHRAGNDALILQQIYRKVREGSW